MALNAPIAIVGGGPVGCVLALALARRGYSLVLLDAGRSRRKVCGEGLLPVAWDVLKDLGVASKLLNKAPIRGIRYQMGAHRGQVLCLEADLARSAYGVARGQLLEALHKELDHSGVEVLRGTKLRDFELNSKGVRLELEGSQGQSSARQVSLLLGADGLQSFVRRRAGLDEKVRFARKRWGTRCYFRSKEKMERVVVSLDRGLESYLTPLGEDLYGLAFLWSPQELALERRAGQSISQDLLSHLDPALRETLPSQDSEFWEGSRAIGPLAQGAKSVLHPSGRIALVGDASGYLDALTGEGLCLGFRQAQILTKLLTDGRLRDYPREHFQSKLKYTITVRALLWLIHQPRLRERVFQALGQSPQQFQALISYSVDHLPWRVLCSPELLPFLRRVALGW